MMPFRDYKSYGVVPRVLRGGIPRDFEKIQRNPQFPWPPRAAGQLVKAQDIGLAGFGEDTSGAPELNLWTVGGGSATIP